MEFLSQKNGSRDAVTNIAEESPYPRSPYTPSLLEQLRQTGRPVVLHAYAKWTPSALINWRLLIWDEQIKTKFTEHDVALLGADHTDADPAIISLLEKHQRPGIPITLVFPAGDPDAEPEVLPDLLTPEIVIGATQRAINENGS